MKVGLWPICEALIISCVLSYSSIVEARLVRFNPNSIHPPPQPTHDNKKEMGNHFIDTSMGKSRSMKNEQIAVVPLENKLPSTLEVTLQDSNGLNHSRLIKEAEAPAGGTQTFSRPPNHSMKSSGRMKKDVAVMAFRPSSSGHSPGVGHDNPPGPMV